LILAGLLLAAGAAVAADKPNGRMQACTQAWQDGGRARPYKIFLRQCLSNPPAQFVSVTAEKRAGKTPGGKRKAKAVKKAARPNRMKICGAQWQKLKAEGATEGRTYREFSKACLKS
jgi:hypothetical protein